MAVNQFMMASSSIRGEVESLFLLGLGSNMGDRLSFLSNALRHLEQDAGRVTARSSVWETEPWGFKAEDQFLNMAVELATFMDPFGLLDIIQNIESSLGRTRIKGQGYRSRVIDIDILFWGDKVVTQSGLQIPHPRITGRRFVLVPLNEIAAGFTHPLSGLTVSELLAKCEDSSEVKLFSREV